MTCFDLKKVEKERALHRKSRQLSDMKTVALVGYTNAGKSTLFNALVGEKTYAKDKLFATLDPLMRKLELPSGRKVVLADTVGFVSDLPHDLIKAFHATLEEVVLADLLVHVHDASSPEALDQEQDVLDVLKTIHADKIPCLDVANKVDRLPTGMEPLSVGIPVSALEGHGIAAVLGAIDGILADQEVELDVRLSAAEGKKLAWLHEHGEILNKQLKDEMWHMTVRLSDAELVEWDKMKQSG